MEKINMILFSDPQFSKMLDNFGLSLKYDKEVSEELIYKEEKTQKCVSCKVILKKNNFGHIAKGSLHLYCDNPSCLTHYVANHGKD